MLEHPLHRHTHIHTQAHTTYLTCFFMTQIWLIIYFHSANALRSVKNTANPLHWQWQLQWAKWVICHFLAQSSGARPSTAAIWSTLTWIGTHRHKYTHQLINCDQWIASIWFYICCEVLSGPDYTASAVRLHSYSHFFLTLPPSVRCASFSCRCFGLAFTDIFISYNDWLRSALCNVNGFAAGT